MNNKFPVQKVSSSLKTKRWFQDSVIYGVDIALNEENSIKPSVETIIANYKIYNGERDTEDMKDNFDPISNLTETYKPVFKTFSTITDRINELVGEYNARGFDYVLAALDRDAVNDKIRENKERITKEINELVMNEDIQDEDAVKQKLEDIVNFRFMSKAEVTGNKVLNYYKTANRVRYKEIEGFRNALITAVVAFDVYIEGNKLKVDLFSSDEIFAVRNGNSNDLRDSEIIAVVKYYPKGKIIDRWGESFTKKDLKKLLADDFNLFNAKVDAQRNLVFKNMEELNAYTDNLNNAGGINNVVDSNGNVRVIMLKWLGYRKMFKRKYYDSNGDTQYDYVSENYKADTDKGEVLTARWFPEWHKGVLVGGDIVIDVGVAPYQYRDVKNPIINKPGLVGGYFNVGNQKAKSVVDLVSPYLYFRDMLFARIEDILSKNMGKIVELDLARKPSTWSVKKVLYYVKRYSIMVVNSFNESDKGRSKGKIAGQYPQRSGTLDLELGASIGYLTNLLTLVDDMIAKVTGVTPQRLGAIQSRELVGNVERSRVQSSLITEIWFLRYEQIILDLYETIIEVSKRAVDVDDRLQFVLDDFSYSILSDGISAFKNSSYGLFPVNSHKYDKLKGILEEMAVNAVPNGQMSMEQFIALYDSNSMPEMVDKQYSIAKENDRKREALEKAKREARLQEIQLQHQYDDYVRDMEAKFDKELEGIKGDYKVLVESMKLQDGALKDSMQHELEINRTKMENEFNQKKLDLERELNSQSNSDSGQK